MSTAASINRKRLKQIEAVSLKSGSHSENAELQACVMEAVSYIAGEPWSDAPQCACPVITAFMVSWNDSLRSDADRDRLLKPLIPEIVGTRSTKETEELRSYLALDWLIRVFTPKWLDMVPALHEQAKALRELDAIVDMAGASAAGIKVRLASKKAAAAWAAARDAAWDAAWDAARDAARDAAWAAARDAARDAAWDAAWDAAQKAETEAGAELPYAAARKVMDAALQPTVERMQASAHDLYLAMINAELREDVTRAVSTEAEGV